jgi:hypothetical protein
VAPKQNYNINWATEKGISYSQYSIYSQCQYRWYLQYVKKIKVFEPSIHLIFGSSFHETFQEFMTIMYNTSAKAANEFDVEKFLKERMLENYKEIYDQLGGKHFVKPEQFHEFIQDGITIMNWIKKKRATYFNIRNTELIGIETPLKTVVTEDRPNVFMIGSIDMIIYEKNTDSYTIYDIKTSTRGWNDNDKRDTVKINQILLYKNYYSQELKIPIEKIDVKFFIVKRKPYENPDFPVYRVQEFSPANGKNRVEKAVKEFKEFIHSCYNEQGELIDRDYPKSISACMYCPFKDKPDLCNRQ